ncbi:hypothetical protein [Sphingorhabdus sp.]|uniref:hypothetical protein n=1 Tax=Sphingorhabdus sp. TaxID=1902408 RepID=UPI0032B882EA
MTDINRRNILGAAGATIALSACSKADKDPVQFGNVGTFGPGDGNDEVPDIANAKERPAKYKWNFEPQFDFLVYLHFENAKLVVKSIFIANEGADDAASQKRAVSKFREHLNWSQADLGYANSFRKFGFSAQTRLYFYLDNDPGDVQFDPVNLIVMSGYKAKDGNKDKLKKLPRNNSFWNDRIVIQDGIELLTVENWYAYGNGSKIPDAVTADLQPESKRVDFSMNIHVRMNWNVNSPEDCIYLVIDPDGTNGIKKP